MFHTPIVGLDKWGRHKNFGFVQMSDMAERICCIEQMNGQVVEELGHKPITVKPASTDTTYSHDTRYVVFLCPYMGKASHHNYDLLHETAVPISWSPQRSYLMRPGIGYQ